MPKLAVGAWLFSSIVCSKTCWVISICNRTQTVDNTEKIIIIITIIIIIIIVIILVIRTTIDADSN